jgi:hypothetical protein
LKIKINGKTREKWGKLVFGDRGKSITWLEVSQVSPALLLLWE